MSGITTLQGDVGLSFHAVLRPQATNTGARSRYGFMDSSGVSAPTDSVSLFRSNNFLLPQIYFNGSLTEGYEYAISSNQWIRMLISVVSTNQAYFHAVDADTGTVIVDTNLTASIPNSSTRAMGVGVMSGHTNSAALAIDDIDLIEAYINEPVIR